MAVFLEGVRGGSLVGVDVRRFWIATETGNRKFAMQMDWRCMDYGWQVGKGLATTGKTAWTGRRRAVVIVPLMCCL